jgi:endonuclease/exonuclease/phosphatase family metal-dependent hydrolase
MKLVVSRPFEFLLRTLPQYGVIGGSSDDTLRQPVPILYNLLRFSELDQGFVLLPLVAGRSVQLVRRVVWAKLHDSETGTEFYVLNTHFTDGVGRQSRSARQESSAAVISLIATFGRSAVVLAGDFNAPPGSESMQMLERVMDRATRGRPATFHGFTGVGIPVRIDHVFTSQGIRATKARVVRFNDQGKYPSDHFPVVVVLRH